jgi:hypothetical protein
MRSTILFLILTAMVVASPACAQTTAQASDLDKLIGDWSGESVCVNKEKSPSCHDEKVVYHITKVADKPNTVNLSADKIVDGKPVFMGAFDFVYDPKKQTLTCEYKTDRVDIAMEFTLKDDVLDGSMTSLPDKTQIRRMTVKKDKK